MELTEKLKRQRVKHIVSSYQLDQADRAQFETVLDMLLEEYPMPLVELAIAETLVANWLTVPMPRGCAFLSQTHAYLKSWETHIARCQADSAQAHIHCSLTPTQFQQITGLDPNPIFVLQMGH